MTELGSHVIEMSYINWLHAYICTEIN